MEHEPTNRRLLMRAVIGGLVAWGVFLGLGAYLGLDPETPDRDIRRLLLVGGSIGLFLAVWLAALWLRSRRKNRP
jgi:membrane protein DedA with SNARE-associated domain